MFVRLCGTGYNVLVAPCFGRAVAVVAGHAVAPSRCAAGWCGAVPRLWAHSVPFCGVRSYGFCPLLWCRGVLWCAVLCCAVLCRAVPCWSVLCGGSLRSFVPCHAVSCRGVSCRGVAGCAVLCRATPCRVVVCPVVRCLVVVRCTAVRCGAVCRVASCCAVYCWAVVCGRQFSLPFRRGVGSALVPLACFVVRDASRGYVAGCWLGGAVRCAVAHLIRAAGVRPCRSGWWVRRVSAGLPSLGACALVPCLLGVLAPSPGCRRRVLFPFWCLCCCLCGGHCCGWSRRLAVRAWLRAAWRCYRRVPRSV